MRPPAEQVLQNTDIVRLILEHGPPDLMELVSLCYVNRAFYECSTAIMYRQMDLRRSYPPDPRTSYDIRMRSLQMNPKLGDHVRHLHLRSLTIVTVNMVLKYTRCLESLHWTPLVLQRKPIDVFPQAPPTVSTVTIGRCFGEEAIYTFDGPALSRFIESLPVLTRLELNELSPEEVKVVLASKTIGCLEHLKIQIPMRYRRRSHAASNPTDGLAGLKSLGNLRSLGLRGFVHEIVLEQIPDRVELLEMYEVSPRLHVQLLVRLSNPSWLPELKEAPICQCVPWDSTVATPQDVAKIASLPSQSDMHELCEAALRGLSQRVRWRETTHHTAWQTAFFKRAYSACRESVRTRRFHLTGDMLSGHDSGVWDE